LASRSQGRSEGSGGGGGGGGGAGRRRRAAEDGRQIGRREVRLGSIGNGEGRKARKVSDGEVDHGGDPARDATSRSEKGVNSEHLLQLVKSTKERLVGRRK